MTIRLYGSWFSPFARKVALALELKSLPYDYVDGLVAENRAEVYKLNPRGEVPVLVDDGVVVINSSDIVQYLEWRYPEPELYPLPSVSAWLAAMRAHPLFAADARRTAAFLKDLKSTSVERRKLFWSGERLEWLLARGFHDWLFGEIAAGRAMFPP